MGLTSACLSFVFGVLIRCLVTFMVTHALCMCCLNGDSTHWLSGTYNERVDVDEHS